MRPPRRVGLLECSIDIRAENARRGAPANQLTLPAEPLAFWNERYPVALLMYGQVATIAEDNGIRILAVTIIADGAFAVLLLATGTGWLAIDSGGRAGPRPVGLWWFWIWFRNSWKE